MSDDDRLADLGLIPRPSWVEFTKDDDSDSISLALPAVVTVVVVATNDDTAAASSMMAPDATVAEDNVQDVDFFCHLLIQACGPHLVFESKRGDTRNHNRKASSRLCLALRPDLVVRDDSSSSGVQKSSQEAYTLQLSSNGNIVVQATARAGLFYGVQTLCQILTSLLLRQSSSSSSTPSGAPPAKHIELPCLRVEDAPRYAWRGMHLDVSRHFFNLNFVLRYIDLLAQHKLNVFHWHLTDDDGWRFKVEAYPDLVTRGAWRGPDELLPPSYGSGLNERYGGYYTKDDIRRVVAYAAQRHITVVPEVDVPGHCKPATACYPEQLLCEGDIRDLKSVQGVSENLLCAGREETFHFLDAIIAELVELFPGPYIHMGGDERPQGPWEQCPLCAQRMRSEGLSNTNQLQGYFMERLRKESVESRGKQMVGWNEIVTQGGEMVARSAVVMAWQNLEHGMEAAADGYPVVMAPAQHTYLDLAQGEDAQEPGLRWAGVLPLKKAYCWSPPDLGVPSEIASTSGNDKTMSDDSASSKQGTILGVHGCLWSETLVDEARADYMVCPRICALSEVAWTPPGQQHWPDFLQRLEGVHLQRLAAQGYGYRPSRQ